MKRWILPTVTLAVGLLIGAGLGAAGKQTTTVAETQTADRTVTVASVDPTPAQVETAAATTPTAAPTPAPKPKPAQRLHFAGNGGLTLKPFRLRHDATLKWTATGGYFGIYSADGIPVNSTGHHGQTFLTAGVQRLQVNAVGSWTITIGAS